MANKSSDSNVTRIKANESAKKSAKPAKAVKAKKVKAASVEKSDMRGPFGAIGRYFKGAWFELRQVIWPTRRATWGLTGAVLAFSAFFVVFILFLDAGFKLLFEIILK